MLGLLLLETVCPLRSLRSTENSRFSCHFLAKGKTVIFFVTSDLSFLSLRFIFLIHQRASRVVALLFGVEQGFVSVNAPN